MTRPGGSGFCGRFGIPEDVEPVIASWFTWRPARAEELTAQICRRPDLRQAATVPLILAFYCIVGEDERLPDRRAVLYDKVIRRMLAGRWRGSGDHDVDPDACLDTLRDWAWSAADSNPVSGTGAWADEFPTPRARAHTRDERDALDQLAVPLSPADVDTGLTLRRFVHRSIREHLVAEHVAQRMPATQAAGELLNHLWYDPDWEYAAPLALAMHRDRDEVLTGLISPVTGGDRPAAHIAAIDGCQEIRRFLARAAQESGESDWSPTSALVIGQARLDIAISGPDDIQQVAARDWPTSNRLILESALGMLVAEANPWSARMLVEAVAGLEPAEAERRRHGRRCSGCWPRPTPSTPDGWRRRSPGWSQPRRSGRRHGSCCSGCWPPQPTPGGPRGWRRRSPGSR
jgi:hypothetical protein